MSVTLEIERAIRRQADWSRCLLVPEAPCRIAGKKAIYYAGTPRQYEWQNYHEYLADFVSVTDAGYATEYEVKVSRADWRADLKKPKWEFGLPSYISRFIYVVPQKLGIPEWVPSVAGVWHLTDDVDYKPITIARVPRRVGKEKVPEKVLNTWRRAFYYRFWRLREDLDRRIPEISERLASNKLAA